MSVSTSPRTCLSVRAVLALALCPFATVAAAQTSSPRYRITDLGTLSADVTAPAAANAVNNAGQVVGDAALDSLTTHAFVWQQGQLTDLGPFGAGTYSQAYAINDAGQIAGAATSPGTGFAEAVRWTNLQMQHLGTSATSSFEPIVSEGFGIGPSGRVVGHLEDVERNVGHAVAWDQPGSAVDLRLGDSSQAAAINARGQIVGSGFPGGAFLWQDGAITFLSRLSADDGSATADAINVAGQIAGAALAADGSRHAVLWQSATLLDLGVLGNLTYVESRGINAAGQVVGTADDSGCVSCGSSRPFLWESGASGLVDLNTLIPADSGWTLGEANGINDLGQIVGSGRHGGQPRAYLLTPVFHATVNFQPSGTLVPNGYAPDNGAVFGPRDGGLSYGWNRDNSGWTRDRDDASSPDQRYDTLTHMQKAGGGSVWELKVPNGTYTVHIVAGDPDFSDSVYKISAEGVLVVSGAPSSNRHWVEGTAIVTVTDGRLTVTNAPGSSNNKICYIDVLGH